MKSKFLIVLTAVILSVSFAGIADAHTTSIGYVPGINPGEVTFWTGSYHSFPGTVNEGTLTLTGVSGTVFGPVTTPFNIGPVPLKPTGLVDGTNNFYWGGSSGAGATFPHNSDQGIGGGVKIWQGVTFGGLNPGTYNFTCGATCGTSAVWASWGTGSANVVLTGQNIGGGGTQGVVPEPATLALFGTGLLGAFVRRKKA